MVPPALRLHLHLHLLLLSFLCLLVMHTPVAAEQFSFVYHKCNDDLGNTTVGSDYSNNRDSLLERISASNKEIDYGFFNFSYGQYPDKVNGIGFCRGDIYPDDCRKCLQYAAVLLRERCGVQKEAIGWYDQCMLRYSNRSIFGVMETVPFNVLCSQNNVTTPVGVFSKTVNDLLDGLRNATAFGDSRRKVAEANATVKSSNATIYAILQCTPDLSVQDCTECLDQSFLRIGQYCVGRQGAQFLSPSCSTRYESFSFFGPLVSLGTSESAPAESPPGQSNKSLTVIAIVVPVVALVMLLLICVYLRVRKQRRKYNASEGDGEGEIEAEADDELKATEVKQFDFETIRTATDNFSDANKLGQGGFGAVYKGRLFDGQQVAIKRLSHNSGQGETEFKNEVLLTGKLQHRNLVRLLGFCLERRERLLVYEFVSNKSLDYIIFDPIKRANLDWEKRYKIIKGITRGLVYLHEDSRLQIIHRDLKTSNILLDEELNPKIADFGMARLFDINQARGSTSTIVGTFGYMAPEYIKHGEFSIKSDVFSFGVMILEILCGHKSSEILKGEIVEDLLTFAWRNWKEGTASNIVDSTLKYDSEIEIMRCIHIGLLCVQEDVDNRPTMTSVLLMLSTSSFPLPDPSEPPFLMQGKRSLMSVPLSEQYSEATRLNDSGSQYTQGAASKTQITDVYPR